MGLQARLMSQAMRKLRGIAALNGVTLIWINQTRDKIGVMFGNPETTTGGKALKFYASLRLDVRRIGGPDGQVKRNGEVVGHKMKIKAVKNKVSAPFKETIVDLVYGEGIDRFADLVSYSKQIGVIEGTSWLSFEGERLAQGMDNTVALLRDQPEVFARLKAAVKAKLAALRDEEQQA